MKTNVKRMTLTVLGLAACVAEAGAATAAGDEGPAYPTKPVRFIVPYVPGGNTDILSRLLGQKLSEAWGQQFIIDNRAGAGGTVGTELAARSPADGYTLVMGSFGSVIVARNLYPRLAYEPLRDLAPVVLVSEPAGVLVANPSVPAKTVAELIVYAKSNPGKLNYGSAGAGAWNHLFVELFKQQARVDFVHIPYKGISPAVTDLMGGQVQLVMSPFPVAMPHVKAGKLRALAVTSAKRSGLAPDIPTVTESGLPGYVAAGWFAVMAPARTPPAIVARLNRELNRILLLPEVRQSLAADGSEPAGGTPESVAVSAREESIKWSGLIKQLNLKLD
jgi:tripartite-type tricarboxylate transporter receptor subunit TctC